MSYDPHHLYESSRYRQIDRWCDDKFVNLLSIFKFSKQEKAHQEGLLMLIQCVKCFQPVCIRRDTRRAFQWRIRNLPYPLTAYQVTVDDDKHGITIRTSNKKYFKKLTIPDMERSRLVLDSNSLTFAHANNTLIVQVTLFLMMEMNV